jgi:hypothetical protein
LKNGVQCAIIWDFWADTFIVITIQPNVIWNPFQQQALALDMNSDAYNYQINPPGIGKDVMSIRNLRILLQLLHDIFNLLSQQPEGV